MNRPLIVGILFVSMVPLYAEPQQPNTAKLKLDAQNSDRLSRMISRLAREYRERLGSSALFRWYRSSWPSRRSTKARQAPEIPAAIRRLSLRAATALKAEQQLRQLRHIDRNPPRLVAQYLSF
jgi:hypothetical protein